MQTSNIKLIANSALSLVELYMRYREQGAEPDLNFEEQLKSYQERLNDMDSLVKWSNNYDASTQDKTDS